MQDFNTKIFRRCTQPLFFILSIMCSTLNYNYHIHFPGSDICSLNPCQSGGDSGSQCSVDGDGYSCKCSSGYVFTDGTCTSKESFLFKFDLFLSLFWGIALISQFHKVLRFYWKKFYNFQIISYFVTVLTRFCQG